MSLLHHVFVDRRLFVVVYWFVVFCLNCLVALDRQCRVELVSVKVWSSRVGHLLSVVVGRWMSELVKLKSKSALWMLVLALEIDENHHLARTLLPYAAKDIHLL